MVIGTMNNYNQRQHFNSPPPMAYHSRNQFQISPNMHSGSPRFLPYTKSPVFNSHANMLAPRNSSPPFPPGYIQRSFNSSNSSPERWSIQSNLSDSGSSSHFADVSQLSPYNSPNRNRGSPYYSQNRNRSFQGRQNFKSPGSNESNPGHSHNIRHYVHPSMLEDPWKDLMAEYEKK